MESNEASSTRPYYRRKLFFSTIVIVLLGAFCAAAGLYALFPSTLGARYGAAITLLGNIRQTLAPWVAGLYIVITGLLVLAVSFLHLFYSHRIAGPAFRLGREAERIGRGDLKADFKLRQNDNLIDIADALKETARQYRETVIAMEQHVAYLEDKAGTLDGAEHRASDPAALALTLQEITTAARAVEKLLLRIRT